MLRPEVAALFELTSRVTRVHVVALSREFDLTRISVAQAEQLVAVPGFDRLRRKPVPAQLESSVATAAPEAAVVAVEVALNDVRRVERTTGRTRAKKIKKGA